MRRLVLLLGVLPTVLAAGLASSAGPTGPSGPDGELPLGRPGLPEMREATVLARGLTHTRIVRGERSEHEVFAVDVAFTATRQEAGAIHAHLRADGYRPRIETVAQRARDDPAPGPLGFLVRVGAFVEVAEANALRAELAEKGYADLRVVYTGEDGGPTTGPWVVNVLAVEPGTFTGHVRPELASGIVPGFERLTAIAARTHALAAVNGGYFVIGQADGTPGDLAGISVVDGALVSEAVNGRTSLVLPPSVLPRCLRWKLQNCSTKSVKLI